MEKGLVGGAGGEREKHETVIAIKISKGELSLRHLQDEKKERKKKALPGNGWYTGHEDLVLISGCKRQAQCVTQPWIPLWSSGPNNTYRCFTSLPGQIEWKTP